MEITIDVFNVGDGDAILVHLSKNGDHLVMVIDAGDPKRYAEKMRAPLQELLRETKKKAPDVVVCSHYDLDHLGGLVQLVEEYGSSIGEIWMHKAPVVFDNKQFWKDDVLNEMLLTLDKPYDLVLEKEIAKLAPQLPTALVLEQARKAREFSDTLKRFLRIVPHNKIRPIFHGTSLLKEWPEVKILGPTKKYFDELFPPGEKMEQFIALEAIATYEGTALRLLTQEHVEKMVKVFHDRPCDILKIKSPSSLTRTNKASIILAIDVAENKRCLFTGDAGICSFEEIPNYEKELKDLYWLKIPHHGSNNNMSKRLAEIMRPVYADCTGRAHQDDEVLECLRMKKTKVRSTKDGYALRFPY